MNGMGLSTPTPCKRPAGSVEADHVQVRAHSSRVLGPERVRSAGRGVTTLVDPVAG